jgi:hypothetical protein
MLNEATFLYLCLPCDKDDMALGNTKDCNLHVQVLCYPESYSNISVDITLQQSICIFIRNKAKATNTAE